MLFYQHYFSVIPNTISICSLDYDRSGNIDYSSSPLYKSKKICINLSDLELGVSFLGLPLKSISNTYGLMRIEIY